MHLRMLWFDFDILTPLSPAPAAAPAIAPSRPAVDFQFLFARSFLIIIPMLTRCCWRQRIFLAAFLSSSIFFFSIFFLLFTNFRFEVALAAIEALSLKAEIFRFIRFELCCVDCRFRSIRRMRNVVLQHILNILMYIVSSHELCHRLRWGIKRNFVNFRPCMQ